MAQLRVKRDDEERPKLSVSTASNMVGFNGGARQVAKPQVRTAPQRSISSVSLAPTRRITSVTGPKSSAVPRMSRPSNFQKLASFSDTAADKLGGGIGRGLLRGIDYLVPGVDTLGTQRLRNFADEWDRRAQASAARQQSQTAARAGATFGSTLKGITDVAALAAPAAKTESLLRGTKALQTLRNTNKAGRLTSNVAANVGGGIPATGVEILQEVGRGNEPDIVRSGLIGVGTDVALPVVGSALKPVARRGSQLLRKADNVIPNQPTKEAEEELIERAAQKADDGSTPLKVKDADLTPENVSKKAVNSLENSTSGIKPNGVARAGGFVENGTARPIQVRRLENGDITIVDGRHTLEYVRQNNIKDFPVVDVTAEFSRQAPEFTADAAQGAARQAQAETPELLPEEGTVARQVVEDIDRADEAIAETPVTVGSEPAAPNVAREATAEKSPLRVKEETTPGQLSEYLSQRAGETRLSDRNAAQRAFDAGRRTFDPYYKLAEIDAKRAEAIGVDRLPETQRLENLADVANAMQGDTGNRLAQQSLEDFGVLDVVRKYMDDGGEFRRYQNVKFGLEVQQKTGKSIIRQDGRPLSLKELGDFVRDYEARNPDAVADARVLKNYSDALLDFGAQEGLITKADADFIKKRYNNYAPIERMFPEDLARPEVGIQPIGTISRQKLIQNIEGSDLPLSENFDVYLKKTQQTYKDAARARLGREVAAAADEGFSPELRVELNKEASQRLNEIKSSVEELKQVRDSSRLKIKTAINSRSKNKIKLKQAETEAGNKVRSILRKTVDDPDARTAIGTISNKEALEYLDNMVEESGTFRPSKKLRKLASENEQIQARINELQGDIEGSKIQLGELGEEKAFLQADPTTGRQIVTTLDEGVQVKTEVSPEIAKVLQGLEPKELGKAGKLLSAIQRPFRATYTGVLNPIFQAVSFVGYDLPMGFLNSPNGIKTVFSPDAWKHSVTLTKSGKAFDDALRRNGAMQQTSTYLAKTRGASIDYMAANPLKKAEIIIKNPKDMQQALQQFDKFGAALSNSTRRRVARAHYKAAVDSGMGETEALAEAVWAFNNIMPNYARTNTTLRTIDSFIPYAGASVAGTRSAFKAARRNPVAFTAKATALLTPAVVATWHNATNEKYAEFYADMQEQGNDYLFENNVVVLTPWAEKNRETGKWEGIIKIPVAPELRAANGAIQRNLGGVILGEGANYADIAKAGFDSMTGQILNDPSNPFLTTAVGLGMNENMAFGGEVVPESMRNLPPEEQVFDSTSDTARSIGNMLGISPIQVDFVLGQFGSVGNIARGRSAVNEVTKRFYGATGMSDSRSHFKDVEEASKSLTEPKDLELYKSLHSGGDSGRLMNAGERAAILINNPNVYKAYLDYQSRRAARGIDIDPMYKKSEGDLRKFLAYQMAKDTDPGGVNAKQIFRENPWMKDLSAERSKFFDSIFEEEPEQKSIGETLQPRMTDELSAKMSQLDAIEDSAERFAFIEANPEIGEYFDQNAEFTRAKREALGLPQFDPYPEPSAKQQQLEDQYYQLPQGDGSRGEFIRNNPDLLALWTARSVWTVQEEGAKGRFENEEFSQKGIKSVARMASNLLKMPDGTYVFDPNTYNRIAEAGGSGGSGYGGYGGYGSSGRKGLKAKYTPTIKKSLGTAPAVPKLKKAKTLKVKANPKSLTPDFEKQGKVKIKYSDA